MPVFVIFPVIFPVSREMVSRNWFDSDCDVSHADHVFWHVGRLTEKSPLALTDSLSGAY